jgi:hypothetical protein
MTALGRQIHKFLGVNGASQLRPEPEQGGEAQKSLVPASPRATLARTHAGETPSVRDGVTVLGRERTAAEVVQELMGALAGEPRVVDCDLTGMVGGAVSGDVFAPVGHYLRHWPAAMLLIRVPDPVERSSLTAMASKTSADRMIIHTGCDDAALQAHRLLPRVQRRTLPLSPAPTAPRAARGFATNMLREWRLPGLTAAASLVLSEFVTHAIISGDAEMAVSLSRMDTRVRIATTTPVDMTSAAVSDLPALPARAQVLVQAMARGWGVIDGRLGGSTMWAVLEASLEVDGDQGRATGRRTEPRHRGPTDPDALAELQGRHGGRHRRDNELPKTEAPR